ncbi:MAG: dihydrodipicolinate synthase family protein [Prolixibacteraceae bacterium]
MEKLEKTYKGVIVPMVTPFTLGYHVDINAVDRIAKNIVNQGAAPFVLGSTGEGPSLNLRQKKELVRATVKAVKGNGLIYAGLTANSFTEALHEAEYFAEAGVDVMVLTLPYYFPIDEVQMAKYFEKIADNTSLPIILYNMPAMVKRSIPLKIADKLSAHESIVGIKDSEKDEVRITKSIKLWENRPDFSYLIGWAARSYHGLLAGADGIVPSTGNLFAKHYVDLYNNVLKFNIEKAKYLQSLTDSLSAIYQNGRDLSYSLPALKVLMAESGWCESIVMPPMLEMEKEERLRYVESFRKKLIELELEHEKR